MRCVSISVVKNEADVIEAMVRHNIQFLNFMTFVDNGSLDGTFEILMALKQEGLPIDVLRDDIVGHVQAKIIETFINSDGCDRSAYVFALDADEFICSDLATFRAFIATAPPSFLMQWQSYVPTDTDDPQAAHVLDRIVHYRHAEPKRQHHLKAVLSPQDTGAVRFSSGNHKIVGRQSALNPTIRLAHFPIRSAAQLACKVLLGSWNIALRGAAHLEAFHWFELAQKIRQGGMPTDADLTLIATNYASERVFTLRLGRVVSPVPFGLRYRGLAKDPLLTGLIQFTDSLVARLAP